MKIFQRDDAADLKKKKTDGEALCIIDTCLSKSIY